MTDTLREQLARRGVVDAWGADEGYISPGLNPAHTPEYVAKQYAAYDSDHPLTLAPEDWKAEKP